MEETEHIGLGNSQGLSKWFNLESILAFLFSVVTILIVVLPLAQIASFDLRIADAFNTDEVEFLTPMFSAFQRGDFDIGRYDYGLLYYNIGLCFFYIFDVFSPLTEETGILIMRLLSGVFLVLNAYVVKLIYKDLFHKNSLLVFVLCLLGSQTMLNYGSMVHPDLAQVFFISLGLLAAIRFFNNSDIRYLLAAGVLAGLAFATKFVGIALLPVLLVLAVYKLKTIDDRLKQYAHLITIVLGAFFVVICYPDFVKPYLTGDPNLVSDVLLLFQGVHYFSIIAVLFALIALYVRFTVRFNWTPMVVHFLSRSYCIGFAFCTGFAIGSPQSIKGFQFLNGLIYVAGLHKDGHWFRNDSGIWGWLSVLTNGEVLHWSIVCAGTLGLLVFMFKAILLKFKEFRGAVFIPFAWVLVFCVVVIFRVKSHFNHYLIPILPVILLYAAYAVNVLLDHAAEFLKEKKARLYLSLIFSFCVAVVLFFQAFKYKNTRVLNYVNSPELAAGLWIQSNLNSPASFIADKYVYIPKNINHQYQTYWGLTRALLRESDSEYLIINEHIYQWFIDIDRLDAYLYGKSLFKERYELYGELIENRHKEYGLEADFGRVKLYKKRPPNGDLSK